MIAGMFCDCYDPGGGGGGGALLNQGDGDPTIRFSQQLKMPPTADTESHFLHPRADTIPHFDSPTAEK